MVEGVEVVIRQPGHPDRVVRLQEGSIRLGRAEDNEIVLSDVGVSRRHSLITVTPSGVQIEDLGSGNGTYYHGYRIKVQELADGDEVVIDPFVLQFRIRGQMASPNVPGRSTKTPARLDVVVGQGMAGSSYPIPPQGLTIGRSEDRDVVIPDPASSRHHVSIYVDGEQYTLKDMGSANGVFVNAVRVRECLLADGDLIRIGNTELRFVLYDENAVETTTQVMAAIDSLDPRSMPTPAAAKQSSGGGSWLALLFGGAMAAFAFVLVVAVVFLLVVVQLNGSQMGFARPEIPSRPPSWTLDLPGALPSSTIDVLFSEGSAAMRANDNKTALQNFYRILSADHGNASAKKFAFAAGEHLVLDVLEEQFDERAKEREERIEKRDALLKKYKEGGRTGRRAKVELLADFQSDPEVRDALDLEPSEAAQELEDKLDEAEAKNSAGEDLAALELYETVLVTTEDDEQRKAARAGMKLARRDLARDTREAWITAVMAQARGEDASAALERVLEKHPDNISARLRKEDE